MGQINKEVKDSNLYLIVISIKLSVLAMPLNYI